MKLSEIKGDRVLDVVADIVEPLSRIVADDDLRSAFLKAAQDEDQAVQAMLATIPMLIKRHKDDAVAILAAINGVEPAEYAANMTLGSLMADVHDLITDDGFTSFLT